VGGPPEGKEQTALMRQAADHVQDYLAHPPRESGIMASTWNEDDLESPVWIEKSVLAHAYLLAEEVDGCVPTGRKRKRVRLE
jgi:hypothetical protein